MSLSFGLLGARLQSLLSSPRAWVMLATLASRGSGFLASFSLSRLAGAPSLVLYISTVITASAVATPIAVLLSNSATLSGTSAPSASWLSGFLKANLLLATGLLLPVCGLFYLMHWDTAAPLADGLALSHLWLVVVGVSTVAGQIYMGVLTGLLNGMGAQVASARLMAAVSTSLMVFSYPAVAWMGVKGAWGLLLLSNWVPVLWQAMLFRRHVRRDWRRQVSEADASRLMPWAATWLQFRAGLPSALGLAITGFVAWFCSIYLVQRYLGAHAMAVIAIANQWMTLMLLPATSWGSVVLRELAHQRLTDPGASWRLVRRLMVRNGAVTLAMVTGVLVFSPWIERGYRLEGQQLIELLCICGLASVLAAVTGVFERVMICWNRQLLWMLLAALSLGAQAVFTWAWVAQSVLYVQGGALLAAVLMLVLGAWASRRALGHPLGGRA